MNNLSCLKQITSKLRLLSRSINVAIIFNSEGNQTFGDHALQSDAVRTVVDPDKQNNIILNVLLDWTVRSPDPRLTTDNPSAITILHTADINEVIISPRPYEQILLMARHLTV